MQTNALIVLAIVALSLIVPILAPFRHVFLKNSVTESAGKMNSRALKVTSVAIFILVAYFTGLSFNSEFANIIFALIFVSCYLCLVLLVFSVKPKYIGLTLGTLCSLVAAIFMLSVLIAFAFDGKPDIRQLDKNYYCEINEFGGMGVQEGFSVTVYHYLGLGLNYKVAHNGYLYEEKWPFSSTEDVCKFVFKTIK
jgi:uncharacterized membrane protein YvlD (DUF360 family)